VTEANSIFTFILAATWPRTLQYTFAHDMLVPVFGE